MIPVADLHSHVLPGIDDGSGSMEESLAMLREAAAQGIALMAATPHFDPRSDTPEAFLNRRNRAAEELKGKMEPGMPRLLLGAEVRYFPGISESEVLPLLTLEGGKALLLELPMATWPEAVWQELAQFHQRTGILPIIAHLDRYIGPFRTRGIPERLGELDVLVQANSSFFLKKTTAFLAMRLLREDKIHLLGSDCHGMDSRRPDLGPVWRKIQPWADSIRAYQQLVLPREICTGEKEKRS
jgi:protein-tyrosine phosphatase